MLDLRQSTSLPAATGAEPVVSVVVLAYNQEAYVERCLDSILATAYPALELIIVDDASRDQSADRVEAWMRAHSASGIPMRFHRCPQNRGIGRNLNQAIAWSSGRYIAPIAADDEILPAGLALRVRHLEAHPHLLAVFADCRVVDADSKRLWDSGIEGLYRRKKLRKSELLRPERLPGAIVFHWGVPGPVMVLRREAFAAVGPYSEDLVVEDWDLYLRLAASGRLAFLDEYVANYRVHGSNSIFRARPQIIEDLFVTAARNAPLFHGFARRRLRLRGFLSKLRGQPQWCRLPVMVFVLGLDVLNKAGYSLCKGVGPRRKKRKRDNLEIGGTTQPQSGSEPPRPA